MKTSIILTSYNRAPQLYMVLRSIQRQIPQLDGIDYEILVVNDGEIDETQLVTEQSDASQGLPLSYLYTGWRNRHTWRTMGFAANIGIKQTSGEIVVLTNSDIFHVGNTIATVIRAAESDRMALSTVGQVWDDDGSLVKLLAEFPYSEARRDVVIQRIRETPRSRAYYPANPNDPFFLAVRREHLERLGGYDEDFIGVASEDNDLLERLQAIGCRYAYAPRDVECIHLYHGRKSIAQLRQCPGFAYNIAIRAKKKGQLVRNQGRNWGELVQHNAPQLGAPIHLVLWVTSLCNLSCPECNQHPTRDAYQGYSMDEHELTGIIASCQVRGLHFSTIEITGGEPTMWPLFKEGLKLLSESGLADRLTFITNGSNSELATETANQLAIHYTVSASQATPQQLEVHGRLGVAWTLNEGKHRTLPTNPVEDALPAECCQRHDSWGRIVRQLAYIRGMVYYCCMAFPNAVRLGQNPLVHSVPFESDFNCYYADRKFRASICSVCLANKKVWDTLPCPS